MVSPSSRSQRSSIRKPIAGDVTVSCFIWCDGQGMKGWMRRLLGFQLMSLATLWTLSQPSTCTIQVSWDWNLLRQFNHHNLPSSTITSLGLLVLLTILILGLQGFRPKKGILSYSCISPSLQPHFTHSTLPPDTP